MTTTINDPWTAIAHEAYGDDVIAAWEVPSGAVRLLTEYDSYEYIAAPNASRITGDALSDDDYAALLTGEPRRGVTVRYDVLPWDYAPPARVVAAQTLYDWAHATAMISGMALHELFLALTGDMSPAGRTTIAIVALLRLAARSAPLDDDAVQARIAEENAETAYQVCDALGLFHWPRGQRLRDADAEMIGEAAWHARTCRVQIIAVDDTAARAKAAYDHTYAVWHAAQHGPCSGDFDAAVTDSARAAMDAARESASAAADQARQVRADAHAAIAAAWLPYYTQTMEVSA